MSEFSPVLKELEKQGWKITTTAKNRHKAKPPQPDRQVVHFSENTTDFHALDNTLSRLRKSGFVWPPPLKAQIPIDDLARPESDEPVHEPAAAVETTDERLERLWRELKEARGYLVLADEQLAERSRQMEEALYAFTAAQTEQAKAVERLKAAKAALDVAVAM